MTTEWTGLPDLQAIAEAQAAGWEIECCANDAPDWAHWSGLWWDAYTTYRARPAQPKMKKVTMLCYLSDGRLTWIEADLVPYQASRIRVPAEDKEIEVPA